MFDEEGRKRKNEKGGPVVTTLKTKWQLDSVDITNPQSSPDTLAVLI